MKSLILRGPARRLFTKLHRWSGLAVLVFLALASATGGVLAFRDEIDRRVNPDLRVVAVGDRRVPLQQVIERVEARFPDATVSTVTLQTDPTDPLLVYLTTKVTDATAGAVTEKKVLEFNQAFVDPYTGDILGQINTSHLIFSREYLIPLIIRFHYSLLLEQPGVWLMGGCAIVWLLTNFVGLALSWPTMWGRLRSWIPILSARYKQGSYKINYDLHRALGVALLPAWIVLSFTSIFLNLPGPVTAATAAFSPLTRPAAGRPYRVGAPMITPDEAIQTALRQMPFARPYGFTRDFRNSRYSIRLRMPGDINLAGNGLALVDFAGGPVSASKTMSSSTAGDRFLEWQFPLHSGEAFGLAGRVVIALLALGMVVMSVTGVYVWWRKWSPRRHRRRRTGPATVGVNRSIRRVFAKQERA